mgnify:FL=1
MAQRLSLITCFLLFAFFSPTAVAEAGLTAE